MNVELPNSIIGYLFLILILTLVLVWFYASGWITIALAAAILAPIVYAIYVLLYRVDRWFKT